MKVFFPNAGDSKRVHQRFVVYAFGLIAIDNNNKMITIALQLAVMYHSGNGRATRVSLCGPFYDRPVFRHLSDDPTGPLTARKSAFAFCAHGRVGLVRA